MKFKVQKFEEIKQSCKGVGDLVAIMVAEPIKKTLINHGPKILADAL
jgi:hypothetical protein